jgi:hypothetical protein
LYLPLLYLKHPPVPGTWVTILNEDFEAAAGPLWRFLDRNGATGGAFTWARRDCRPNQGSYSAWAVGGGADGAALPCGSPYPDQAAAWMIYGPFSLADATAAELRFRLWLDVEPEADSLCWLASADDASYRGLCLALDTAGWTTLTLDLADVGAGVSLLRQPRVWIAFAFLSDDSSHRPGGAYVDGVQVRACVGGRCQSGGGVIDW